MTCIPSEAVLTEVETIIMTREGGEMGGWSGRTYGKGRRGRRWQGDDPICCSSVGVSSVT